MIGLEACESHSQSIQMMVYSKCLFCGCVWYWNWRFTVPNQPQHDLIITIAYFSWIRVSALRPWKHRGLASWFISVVILRIALAWPENNNMSLERMWCVWCLFAYPHGPINVLYILQLHVFVLDQSGLFRTDPGSQISGKKHFTFFLFYLHHFSPFSSLACYHTGVWPKLSSSPFLNRTNREAQVSLDSELTASSNFNQPFHLLYEAVNLLSSSTWDQLVKDLQAHRSQNCLSLPGAKWVSPGL